MQTASLKTPSSPLASMVKAVAAIVVIGLFAVMFGLLPVLTPFLVLPLAHVIARWGLRFGAVVTVVAMGLIYAASAGGGESAVVLIFFLLVGVGVVLGEALRRGWSFGRTFGLTIAGALVAFVLFGVVAWLAFGLDLTTFKQVGHSITDDLGTRYTQLGLSQASAQSAASQLRRLVDIMPFVAAGLAGMGAILLAACSMGLAYWIFPRLRAKVAVTWRLGGFRMHWATAYASIVGLGLLLFAGGDAAWRHVFMYVGINLLLVSQTLFFIQGLAVARWFSLALRLRPGSRFVLFLAAVVAQVLQLTGLVGLLDTWLDYRKRYATRSSRAGTPGNFHKE